MKRIGVLAVQGAFAEHLERVTAFGAQGFEIRQCRDLPDSFDGLILPGGESTGIKKLLHELGLFDPLLRGIREGLPVLGTCAGMILLARAIDSGEAPCFGTLDVTVRRNAYGRQLGSFRCTETFAGHRIEMPFIRAPYVTLAAAQVQVLAEHKGRIVAVREGHQLACAFHPELTEDPTVYRYFWEML